MTFRFHKKVKKLIKNPGIFFRDYLNKRHATFTNEQKVWQNDEGVVVDYELQLCMLESRLTTNQTPIDVVFTWVDNNDEVWQQQHKMANAQLDKSIGLYANDNARFENHNELYYAVHSILTYLNLICGYKNMMKFVLILINTQPLAIKIKSLLCLPMLIIKIN